MNIVSIIILLYGLFRLISWLRVPHSDYFDLLLALLFICMSLVFLLHSTKYNYIGLGFRYLFGLFVVGIAYFVDQTLFMWIVALFILITAIIDTIWPKNISV